MSVLPIEPVYFRNPVKPLFGCYHAALNGQRPSCGVLICPPVGHEYVNCHRALRQLSTRLAGAGFPVLRFDYYGCGDSSGRDDEGTVQQWLEDISAAVVELRHRALCCEICVIGLRLGATLGMIAGAKRAGFDSLVLWDPVVDGTSYLGELLQLQKEMSGFRPKPSHSRLKVGRKSAETREVLGFPLPQRLRSELEEINLLNIAEAPAKNVLVMESGQLERGHMNLKDHLSRCPVRLEHRRFDSLRIWLPTANGSLLVPFPLLQSLVSWTCEMHS
jgi:pimeloyl-ACP methyl ester carboxylesterase